MHQPIELLSLLYELSLTNLKHFKPEETARSFLRKFISRKSLQAGSVWSIMGAKDGQLYLKKIYATPEAAEHGTIDLKRLREVFGREQFVVTHSSLIKERELSGSFAYFKLNDFGILELFYNGATSINFCKSFFIPFVDVIAQLALSLESKFFYQKLQKEVEQRNIAEKSLKNSEQKYRRIIDNIKLGLIEVDNDEIIQHANRPFLELTGYRKQDVIGKSADMLAPDSEVKGKISGKNVERTKGYSDSYELKIKAKDNTEKWVIISGAPNYDAEGKVIGSIGIHLDITKEKKLKRENEFKTNQLQKLFEKSLDGLISINAKGEVFEWSPQAEVIFGFERREVMGKKLSDLIVPQQHRSQHDFGMENYLKSYHGSVLNNRVEILGLRKGGEEFPIELTIFPLEYENEHYFTAFVRDITEIKKSKENMEKALERQKELNTMKSKFISTTSHELRTPLTTIRSNTELLNYQIDHSETLKPERLKKNVIRIENNVDRLNQLINNILMIGKLDSEKVPFEPRVTDVVEFIEKNVLPDFDSRQQPVQSQVSGKKKSVELDTNLFSHIMTNLLENAIKYSPGGTPPDLLLRYEPSHMQVHVADKGIGIPKSEQAKLFDTFYRASNVDNIQGTGLGLSIVQQFVQIHGGTIAVESEEGEGATFILTFPYTQKART